MPMDDINTNIFFLEEHLQEPNKTRELDYAKLTEETQPYEEEKEQSECSQSNYNKKSSQMLEENKENMCNSAVKSDSQEQHQLNDIDLPEQECVNRSWQHSNDETSGDKSSEKVVLDPDHPLLNRFQNALKSHLQKRLENVEFELNEVTKNLKSNEKKREDVGMQLYHLQHELVCQQKRLEDLHKIFYEKTGERQKQEEELSSVRHLYKSLCNQTNEERKKETKLRENVEALSQQVGYLNQLKESSYSDTVVTKRAVKKSETEKSQLHKDKLKQDLLVHRLMKDLHTVKDDIFLLNTQCVVRREDSNKLHQRLTEANTEMESVQLEKQQLLQEWKKSILAMSRCDEAYAAGHELLRNHQDQLRSLKAKFTAYKKDIRKELERNEYLNLILQKQESEKTLLKSATEGSMARLAVLERDYMLYEHTIQETEATLDQLSKEQHSLEKQIENIQNRVRASYQEKIKKEDAIFQELHKNLTLNKTAKYNQEMAGKIHQKTKQEEMSINKIENQISKMVLEITGAKTRIQSLQDHLENLSLQANEKSSSITSSENETKKRDIIIEKRQNTVNKLRKKLEELINLAGGEELGPIEIKAKNLLHEIQSKEHECHKLEQQWLQQQKELVTIKKEVVDQMKQIDKYHKQLIVLNQRKINTENEIVQQQNELQSSQKKLHNLQNDIVRLNSILHEKKDQTESLEQKVLLQEDELAGYLKDAELECVQLEEKLERMKREHDNLKILLNDTEQEVMLWEKKLEMSKETKQSLSSDVHLREIQEKKNEIRQLQMHHEQLKREQDKLLAALDRSVSKWDIIATKIDIQVKCGRKKESKIVIQRKLEDVLQNIKTTKKNQVTLEKEHQGLKELYSSLRRQLSIEEETLQKYSDELVRRDQRLTEYIEKKYQNIIRLSLMQQKTKYFQSAKEGKYQTKISVSNIEKEEDKIRDRLKHYKSVAETMIEMFPSQADIFQKVIDIVASAKSL
ncbi:lethal (2) 41Ab isoform X2 [Tachypleus tridentatus]|uniref:lethal (2) 41Ab isoform X2 n=1 Tax=Tachypleus tridentatus TaxID=6853 RepID=UPI003FCF3E60